MYIHLGLETEVEEKEIVGIFDLDTSTVSKKTREFLAKAEKRKEIISITNELPKSFILCNKKGKNTVYISQLMSSTLQKRAESKETEF